MNEFLTVVIPSYNHEEYIINCLKKASEINNAKFLIIDDGSTDETKKNIKNFLIDKNADKWRFVEKNNSGLVSSLNLALRIIDTEYVCFCASDDEVISENINNFFLNIDCYRDYPLLIFGAKAFLDGSERREWSVYSKKHDKFFEKIKSDINCLYESYPEPILLQSTIFKKQTLIDIGGWDSDLKLDDYPIFLKILKKYSGDIYFNPNLNIVRYRQHAGNTYKKLKVLYSMVEEVLIKYAPINIRDKVINLNDIRFFLSSIKNKNLELAKNILGKYKGIDKIYFFLKTISYALKK